LSFYYLLFSQANFTSEADESMLSDADEEKFIWRLAIAR
jgi:hypothetical protein